jgi:WD40 repeat protein
MSISREANPADIDRLIRQLGSPKFRERENATKTLKAIGEPALQALREAATNSDDAEICRRAASLVSLIEDRLAASSELRCLKGHKKSVGNAVFSPDGHRILSGSDDGTMRLWDVDTGKELRRFELRGWQVYQVAFSPDGRHALSTASGDTLRLWDVETGKELRCFAGGALKGVYAVAFSSDGHRALTATMEHLVCLWDLETGKELRRFADPPQYLYRVAMSADDRQALAGSEDGTMTLWDVASGNRLRSFEHESGVYGVAFSRDGRYALSGSGRSGPSDPGVEPAPPTDCVMRLWEVKTGKELRCFTGHTHVVTSVAFSPDGRGVVSASCDGTIRLWDLESGRQLRWLKGHEGAVNSVTFSADGSRVLSAGSDGTVRLWKLPK